LPTDDPFLACIKLIALPGYMEPSRCVSFVLENHLPTTATVVSPLGSLQISSGHACTLSMRETPEFGPFQFFVYYIHADAMQIMTLVRAPLFGRWSTACSSFVITRL
jgi:hypothetical protein